MTKVQGAMEMAIGELRSFSLNGEAIGVYRKSETEFYTFEDVCTHDGAAICDGTTEGDLVMCPRHGAKFDMRDGSVQRMPATSPLDIFENEIRSGELYVELD